MPKRYSSRQASKDAMVEKLIDTIVDATLRVDKAFDAFAQDVVETFAGRVIKNLGLDLEATLQGIRDEYHRLRVEESD